MISTEMRKCIVRLIVACVFYSARANASACHSNKKLYTEIGCTPVYGKDLNSCPVAYDCENIFTRPEDKCYFNGNVYKPRASLSETDLALNPCLAVCYCNQSPYNNKSKFACAIVRCPLILLNKTCSYFQYDRDSCCVVNIYCPEEKAIVHKCSYEGTVYKKGQQIYIGDDDLCVCSESFNNTINDESCRKIGCDSDIFYMEDILIKSAPIFYEKADGCPIQWHHPNQDVASATTSVASQSLISGHVCMYGNLSFPLGQNVTIAGCEQFDSDTHKTLCSCSVPPLVTCVITRLN